MNKPLILVTNDDGISASGIRNLIRIMNDIGDVFVVAPDRCQSGMGHAITIEKIISCDQIDVHDGPQIEYVSSGTPADCVKLALNELLPSKPDLCVAGINHGSNSSINVLYSGTMSAAIEASLSGIPSIGFSLLDNSKDADFSESESYIRKITKLVLEKKIKTNICFNVNIPKTKLDEKIKGVKICRQANANWQEEFRKKKGPNGGISYWLTGKFINYDKGRDTDEWALSNHYVSIVPIQHDLTAHNLISNLKESFNE